MIGIRTNDMNKLPKRPFESDLDTMLLLKAKDVHKYFYHRPTFLERIIGRASEKVTKAVDGITLDIYRGETLGLVGESGCGKSTLGRVIVGLYAPTAGEIWFDGVRVDQGAASSQKSSEEKGAIHEKRKRIQMIFQNPYSSLNPRKTVRQIIGVALEQRGVPLEEREEETVELLRKVGLKPEHIDFYPRQFSGGQRQRIGIARALAVGPSFIVADEPVSSLDVSIQAQVLNLLLDLQKEFGLTYLFISHDLAVVHHVSHRVAVMYLGNIVEIGPTEDIFENPLHPYTKALLSAIPRVENRASKEKIYLKGTVPTAVNPPPGCKFQTRCPVAMPVCTRESPPKYVVSYDEKPTVAHSVWCHKYS